MHQEIRCYDIVLELDETNTLLLRMAMESWMKTPIFRQLEIKRSIEAEHENAGVLFNDSIKYHFSRRGPSLAEYLVFHHKQLAWEQLIDKAAAIISLKLNGCDSALDSSDETRTNVNEMDTFIRTITGYPQSEKEALVASELTRRVRMNLPRRDIPRLVKVANRLVRSIGKTVLDLLLKA